MEYQNIFTQVQVQGPPEMGMDPTGDIARERTNKAGFSKLAGILGNAQLGPKVQADDKEPQQSGGQRNNAEHPQMQRAQLRIAQNASQF